MPYLLTESGRRILYNYLEYNRQPFCHDDTTNCRWSSIHTTTRQIMIYSVTSPIKIYFRNAPHQVSFEYIDHGINLICLCNKPAFENLFGNWNLHMAADTNYELVPVRTTSYQNRKQCFILLSRHSATRTVIPTLKQLCLFAASEQGPRDIISNASWSEVPKSVIKELPLIERTLTTLYLPPIIPYRYNRSYPTCLKCISRP